MKRLYTVTVEANVVVLASDMGEAMDVALNAVRCDGVEFRASAPGAIGKSLPDGWDFWCIPFGNEDDKTIGQIMNESDPVSSMTACFCGTPIAELHVVHDGGMRWRSCSSCGFCKETDA